VKFSALAGNPLPTMCKELVWNDGVVPVSSAKWTIADTAESKSLHTDLTGTKDFSDFVKPRLATGPKGDHNPDVTLPAAAAVASYSPAMDISVDSFHTPRAYGMRWNSREVIDPIGAAPTAELFARSVRLMPKQSAEVEIPVGPVRNFGITFMAQSVVSATLLNNREIVVGKNLADSPEAGQWFRSIFVDNGITAGIWKLKFENTGDRETEVILTAWWDAVK